ncbi:MAG: exosortase/archaeosortase family protein [Candidatus Obscuribacterales bacterium]|nr:exosortase/archaeosortase family protein [Candidatus Obscuribacterales bacterium]
MDKAQATVNRLSQPLTLAALAVAFWPLWSWYAARTMDKSDEPWGLCALLTVTAILLHEHFSNSSKTQTATSKPFDVAGTCALMIYVITFPIAPNLLQAVLAVLALWFLVVARMRVSSHTGALGLLLLSLPVIPSLNFFAGYPLRLIVTYGVVVLLNALGLQAVQESTMIRVNNELIAVDAPCSGISMLWAEAYVVALSSCLLRFNIKNTLALSFVGLGLILVGNTLRATALSISSQLDWNKLTGASGDLEGQIHTGVGLLVFCAVAVATMLVAQKIAGPSPSDSSQTTAKPPGTGESKPLLNAKNESTSLPLSASITSHFPSSESRSKMLLITCGLACVAAIMPLVFHHDKPMAPDPVVTWPTSVNGHQLTPVASPAEEAAFAAEFPGRMRRFSDGNSAYFVRVVNRETRQLHPSSDCFRGLGYSTEPKPLVVMEDGSRWSCFEAKKGNTRLRVLERIYDTRGRSWTDVSEWYWSAVFGRTAGPWFDITIAQPV